MATTPVSDSSAKCTKTGTNTSFTDPAPDEVTYDFSEAVKCLFCCCCSGSGSGSDSGSSSGSGSGTTPCCEGVSFPSTDTFPVATTYGTWLSDPFDICSIAGGNQDTELTVVNATGYDLLANTLNVLTQVDPPACASTSEIFPNIDIPFESPLSLPAGGSLVVTMTYENLEPCCVYNVYYHTVVDLAPSFMVALPSSKQAVDTGVEAATGTAGIAQPGCLCFCTGPIPATITKSVAPIVPFAEAGFAVSHEFMDLPGELNCRYLWKLHVTWTGKGEGYLFARDRCSVLHIDKRSRDSADLDYSPPVEEFDYQLMVCGPTTICMQMKNKVVDGISQAGRVIVSAERLECMSGSTPDCCCGPYPACTCDPTVAPVITCQAQKENLPVGWLVDETAGRLVAGHTDDVIPVIGLAYTVAGDISCAYKVRLELELDVGADCVPIFMGGDYVAVAVGEDGRGSLYADLWVCGGTVFTLLLSGQMGEATFKVAYAGESRIQTPICCQ